ncbi:MAG TPA: periplasmic heavy metal sensor [Thermodesulfobacteriota bacterium]|nr:periplasmic heavy metal sensor [Thermodesulfobacteriota bacterium]
MKLAVAAIIILLSSVYVAEGATDKPAPNKPMPNKIKRVSTISSQKVGSLGRFSTRLNRTISATGRLELTPEQKDKVQALRKEYVVKMARDENEARDVEKEAFDAVGKPSFDPAAVKKQFKKLQDLEAGLADSYVTALASLRDIIGEENYAKVSDPRFALSNDLIQTRQRGDLNRADELDVEAVKKNAADAEKAETGADASGEDKSTGE